MLFPEVSFMDTQLKTNNEKRPLFLACGKDSEQKSFTYLRSFLLSECRWVFHWLMHRAIPMLVGTTTLKGTRLHLTDGDTNEYRPIEMEIARGTYESSTHGLCGFHLVDRALNSHPVGSPGGRKKNVAFSKIVSTFKSWLYSWMSTIESMEEYELSKKRLFSWLKGPSVLEVTGDSISENMRKFVIKRILPYESKYLRVGRMYLRSFDEYCNSVAEAEGSAMKQGHGVMPYMSIPTTVENIHERQARKSNLKDSRLFQAVTRTPLWSSTSTAMEVTTYAEGLNRGAYEQSTHYSWGRLSKTNWLVRRTQQKNDSACSPLPQFVRTRRILMLTDSRLVCSCGYFEKHSLVCHHICSILGRLPMATDCTV